MTIITLDSDSPSSPLPLDWTRVSRKRRATGELECCEDPASCRRQSQHSRSRFTAGASESTLKGYAIFCLHDTDPPWLQGYFLPENSRRPWGLLAVQEEIDDCLACHDGGFRRVSLTIFRSGTRGDTKKEENQKRMEFKSVDWTGGDMMRLNHSKLQLEPDRLWTGKSTLPYISQYFSGLISKLRKRCDISQDSPILDWLPDIAIVVGKMTLVDSSSQGNDQKDNDL